jgi:hypothetical protein
MTTKYEDDVTDRIAQMSAASGVLQVAARKGPLTPEEKEWHFVMCSRDDGASGKMLEFLERHPRHTITLDNGSTVDMPFIDYRSRINGFTALHYAAQYIDIKTTMFLLNKGANPNIKSFSGLSPLHVIAQSKPVPDSMPKKNVVAFYLLGGMNKSKAAGISASPHIRDHHGRRPVDLLPAEHTHLKELFAGHTMDIGETTEPMATVSPSVKRRGKKQQRHSCLVSGTGNKSGNSLVVNSGSSAMLVSLFT